MNQRQTLCRHRQAGAYLILIPVIILAIVAGLALSIDVGNAMADRQRARSAADAAALAGAFAVRKDKGNLESADAAIREAAEARVLLAVRTAATDNGFEHGVDNIQVNYTWPPDYTDKPDGDTGNYYAGDDKYIRVTVVKPMDFFFSKSFLPAKFVGASAVGRVGTNTRNNTCPGLYIYGDGPNKVLDLKNGSDFFINDGGIYISYSGTGTALYGSAGATMTADWIEVYEGGITNSVDYFCYDPPGSIGDAYECVPDTTSETRELPYEDELPINSCSAPEATHTRCINGGYDFGRCTAAACEAASCTTLGNCTGSTCRRNCLTTTNCPSLVANPTPTRQTELQAGEYCEGLTLVNTGTSAVPFNLRPSASTNIFNLNGDNMFLMASYVDASGDDSYEGVVIYSNPDDGLGTGLLQVGNNNASSASVLGGDLRIYFNLIELYYSTLSIDTFFSDDCGLEHGITTTVVQ